MPWAAITAIGTVFAGLALPLAFVQLGALRQDRLREQISKIGAWTETDEMEGATPSQPGWNITLFIRNNSKLPVDVGVAGLNLRPSEPENGDKNIVLAAGLIPPETTWHRTEEYRPEPLPDTPLGLLWPRVTINLILVTDAAGLQWSISQHRTGPPRRHNRRHTQQAMLLMAGEETGIRARARRRRRHGPTP